MRTRNFALYTFIVIAFQATIFAQNKQVVDSLQQIISIAKQNDTTLIKAYNDLGIQYATSNPEKAKKLIRKSLFFAKKLEASRGIAGANNCLGIVYFYQKHYDSALVHFKNAYQINKNIEHQWGQASALHQIGVTQNLLNQHKEAISSFEHSSTIFQGLGDSLSYAKSIENIGVAYKLIGNQKKAIEYFLEANKLFEQLNDVSGIGRGYMHLSALLNTQGEYQKALDYLELSLPLIEKSGNNVHTANLLVNMGKSHSGLQNYEQALYHFKKALDLKMALGKTKTIAVIQSCIGDTYYDLELYSEAVNFQKKALHNYTKKGELVNKAITNNSIAKSYLKLSRLDSSKYHAKQAIENAKQIENLKQEKEANQTLALIAEEEGNSEAAYQHYKRLSHLKDTLKILQKEAQARELQAKYETNKKEQKISELALLNEKTKQEYIAYIVVLGLGVFGLGILLFQFFKTSKEKDEEKSQLHQELYIKKKQLTTNSLHLAKKNKILEHLKEEMQQLKYNEVPGKQFNYQKLIQTINFDEIDDKDWENFKNQFEQLHQDFYANIKQQYPEVTQNELRIMALIKMNLSSKEIARVLHITQEGVRKARYRLRKKLNIDSNQKLMEMILNI